MARRLRLGAVAAALALPTCLAAPPNFLVILMDQWRFDWAGFHPDRALLRVPNLQSFASQGTRFNKAYTPAPWCVPARFCLATIRTWDSSPAARNGQDFPYQAYKPWFAELHDIGYHTMTVGKDDLTQSRAGTGINGSRNARELGFEDWWRTQDKYATYLKPLDQYGALLVNKTCGSNASNGSTLFDCQQWCYGKFHGRGGNCCQAVSNEGFFCPVLDQVGDDQEDFYDNVVEAQAEAVLDRAPAGKPWVMQVNFPSPHPPMVLTRAMNESVANRSFPVSADNMFLDPGKQVAIRRQYAGLIENLDELIGRLLAKVDAMGATENTYVIITADHGEQLGDHNSFGKKKPWEGSIRVPLLVRGPGVAAGRVVEVPVSTLDAIGTMMQEAGVAWNSTWEGTPLTPLLQAELDEGAFLAAKPAVSVGLTAPGMEVGGGYLDESQEVDFRILVKYINETHTLKVVCCPVGCPPGNSRVQSTYPKAQVLMFNVAQDNDDAMDEAAWDWQEARDLADMLPGSYREVCQAAATRGGAAAIPAPGSGSAASMLAAGAGASREPRRPSPARPPHHLRAGGSLGGRRPRTEAMEVDSAGLMQLGIKARGTCPSEEEGLGLLGGAGAEEAWCPLGS